MPSPEIKVRPVAVDDMKFILSSWKQSWRTSPWAGTVRNDEYFKAISSTIEGLVARGADFKVAYFERVPTRILGWVCYEVLQDGLCCIHYVYIKDPYLNMGVGKKLIDECPGEKPGLYTHRYRHVVDSFADTEVWRHAPEVARRK